MLRHSLLALALLSTASPAAAWTYNDYTSGTPLEQVKAALAAKGGSLELVSGASAGNPTDVYVVQPANIPVLTFCNGRLTGYSDRIQGNIRAFLERVEREALKGSSTLPTYRLGKDARTGYELTEAQWYRPNGVMLSLSWSAAGGSGVGLETVTQECQVGEPDIYTRANTPPQPSAAEAPGSPAPPSEIAAATPPAPASPPDSAASGEEALTGTLHTPGVEIRDGGEAPATGVEAPDGKSAADVASSPAEPAEAPSNTEKLAVAALPSEPAAPPASSGSAASPGPDASAPATRRPAEDTAPAAQAALPAEIATPAVQATPAAEPAPAVPAQAAAPAPSGPADAASASAKPSPEVAVPLPPEAPVDLAVEPKKPEPASPPAAQVAVVLPPPPEPPPPVIPPQDAGAPDAGAPAAFPTVANVPLPPPRPAGLVVRRDAVPAAQRTSVRGQRPEAKPAPEPELPGVIIPGTDSSSQVEPALEGGESPPTAALSPRPPADVGPRTIQVDPQPAPLSDNQGDSAGDETADVVPARAPAPATTESTASVKRRGGPSTPEQCAAAFRSYDPATRTYRALSGAIRSCP